MLLEQYDQEFAMQAYGHDKEVKGSVETFQFMGGTREGARDMLTQRFNISESAAEKHIREFWKEN